MVRAILLLSSLISWPAFAESEQAQLAQAAKLAQDATQVNQTLTPAKPCGPQGASKHNLRWAPTRNNLIAQITVELSDAMGPDGRWGGYVERNASRLKAYGITWDDFKVVYFNSKQSQGRLPGGQEVYEAFLARAPSYEPIDFTKESNRSYDFINRNVYTVHATDFYPEGGVVRMAPIDRSRPIFRPTQHFFLGGMVRQHTHQTGTYSWENKRYAVITPLQSLYPQMVNLFGYDSFIVGDLHLGDQAIVILPESEKGSRTLPKGRVVYYDPSKQTLRQAVNETLDYLKAWKITAQENNTDELAKSWVDGVNVNHPDFFAEVYKRHPQIGFGAHFFNLRGNNGAQKAGMLDGAERVLVVPSEYTLSPSVIGVLAQVIEREEKGLMDYFKAHFEGTPLYETLTKRRAESGSIAEQVKKGVFARLGAISAEYDDAILSFFAQNMKYDDAKGLIEGAGNVGVLSVSDRLALNGLRRQLRLDASLIGSFNEKRAKEILQRVYASPNASRLLGYAVNGFNDSDENSLRYQLSLHRAGHGVLARWISLLYPEAKTNVQPSLKCVAENSLFQLKNEAGSVLGSFFQEEVCARAASSARNGMACVSWDNGYVGPVLLSNGARIGSSAVLNADQCFAMVEGSTQDAVCAFSPQMQVAHYSPKANLPISPRIFPDFESCVRMTPNALEE